MNVAVLGAGGGGLAVAYEWASRGHRVSLYAQRAHDHHLAPVRDRGGIQAEGVLDLQDSYLGYRNHPAHRKVIEEAIIGPDRPETKQAGTIGPTRGGAIRQGYMPSRSRRRMRVASGLRGWRRSGQRTGR
jgi:2-polyprenyl-6-methoxyphenol hydroxylase-like FAD-dependent oxidoreductase